jgi:hypothetical protein
MRQLLENLVALAREDIFYGQYGRWHVVPEIDNGLSQVVRCRRGLHQARQYQLSVARSLELRWRPWFVNLNPFFRFFMTVIDHDLKGIACIFCFLHEKRFYTMNGAE